MLRVLPAEPGDAVGCWPLFDTALFTIIVPGTVTIPRANYRSDLRTGVNSHNTFAEVPSIPFSLGIRSPILDAAGTNRSHSVSGNGSRDGDIRIPMNPR